MAKAKASSKARKSSASGAKKSSSAAKKTTSRAKAKPVPTAVHVTADPDGGFIYRVLDADGKEIEQGGKGSRNRMYARKVAQAAYPDIPVEFA